MLPTGYVPLTGPLGAWHVSHATPDNRGGVYWTWRRLLVRADLERDDRLLVDTHMFLTVIQSELETFGCADEKVGEIVRTLKSLAAAL